MMASDAVPTIGLRFPASLTCAICITIFDVPLAW